MSTRSNEYLLTTLLGMYFDAAEVFVKKSSLLFRLALAILWPGHLILLAGIGDL